MLLTENYLTIFLCHS